MKSAAPAISAAASAKTRASATAPSAKRRRRSRASTAHALAAWRRRRYRRISALVELSCVSAGSAPAVSSGDDALGQNLAELDAPLIEGVDAPDRALGENIVLVERDQRAERMRRQPLGEDHVGRPVALADAERRLRRVRAFRRELLGGLAERQRLGLGEQVRHQEVVLLGERAQGPAEADHVAGDQLRPLMDELVERMLAVGPRLAPDDRPGLHVDSAGRRDRRACRCSPSPAAGDRRESARDRRRRA